VVRTTLHASENGSNLRPMIGAVIYVRVSTKEQTENLSLPTQIGACEEYCRREGYEVLERFKEEGESAKTTDRTELQNLLKYCRTHKGKVHLVIVYNLTRFAREKYDHFALRAFLKSLGISLRSATEPIDDTSTGKLMEGVLAAFAQFDNDVRSERTRAGMQAALEQGRWTFVPPLGYLNAPKWSGKSLIPEPERGALVTRAFEEFATGRFTKEEVLGKITRLGFRTRKGLTLNPQSFGRMLTNRLYAGLIHVPEFDVSRRGDFEPLVSEEMFYRVQAVLEGRVQVTGPHQRSRPDFPLKGLVRCEACGRTLTASWSKGRNGRYAYYHCWRQCRSVNVSKAKLEGLFADELKELQPTAELDRLDEAFLFAQSIDIDTYDRHKDKLRQELTLLQIDQQRANIWGEAIANISAIPGPSAATPAATRRQDALFLLEQAREARARGEEQRAQALFQQAERTHANQKQIAAAAFANDPTTLLLGAKVGPHNRVSAASLSSPTRGGI
jgi:DNA invertase Pin-like site-specific DNA recombinase